MKTKRMWLLPVAAFTVAVLGAGLTGPSWASLFARSSAAMQAGGTGLTLG